jgi:hypothetical protein
VGFGGHEQARLGILRSFLRRLEKKRGAIATFSNLRRKLLRAKTEKKGQAISPLSHAAPAGDSFVHEPARFNLFALLQKDIYVKIGNEQCLKHCRVESTYF